MPASCRIGWYRLSSKRYSALADMKMANESNDDMWRLNEMKK